MKRTTILTIALIGLYMVLPQLLHATPPGGGDPGQDPDVPIDGGLSVLFAAGVAYSVKKYREAVIEKRAAGKGMI